MYIFMPPFKRAINARSPLTFTVLPLNPPVLGRIYEGDPGLVILTTAIPPLSLPPTAIITLFL